jgi:hypothetical protein
MLITLAYGNTPLSYASFQPVIRASSDHDQRLLSDCSAEPPKVFFKREFGGVVIAPKNGLGVGRERHFDSQGLWRRCKEVCRHYSIGSC